MSKSVPWKIIIIVVTVLLALGWAWTDLAKDKLKISDQLRINILIGITVLFALKEGSVQFLKEPASLDNVNERRAIIEDLLERLIIKYNEEYKKKYGKDAPEIRTNIMLPLVKFKLLTTCLKIRYQRSSSGMVEYNRGELDLEWKKQDGTQGRAWDLKDMCLFDTVNTELNKIKMTQKQREKTAEVKTTISVPVCYNKSVVGVVNLDSKKDNIDVTKFNAQEMAKIFGGFATNIAPLLFENGVEEG